MTYTIPKPKPSIGLASLFILVGAGLVALFLAALFAFSQIMPIYQAIFAAVLIEAAIVIEAIAVTKKQGWAAGLGLIISISVSGTYNYIQAQIAGEAANINDWWQLLVLALGPLFALTTAALSLGNALRVHELSLETWAIKRQNYLDRERRRQEKREDAQRQVPEISGNLPEENQRVRKKDLKPEDIEYILSHPPVDSAVRFSVSKRTVRLWRAEFGRTTQAQTANKGQDGKGGVV